MKAIFTALFDIVNAADQLTDGQVDPRNGESEREFCAAHEKARSVLASVGYKYPDGSHYPGPWTLRKRRDGSYNVYCASHDVALAVAPCNASLVRAAPDLLRALQRLADCPDLNLEELEPETIDAIAQARAALAMAADGLPD